MSIRFHLCLGKSCEAFLNVQVCDATEAGDSDNAWPKKNSYFLLQNEATKIIKYRIL